MRDHNAAILAEQATVGALMLEPAAIGAVGSWLRRSDFSQSWLGGLYLRLRERHRAGEACDAQSVGLALAADPHASPRVLLPGLLDVLQATPVNPQPEAYARLVLESGIRRDVDGLGVVLRAGALAAARRLDPAPLQRTAAEVVSQLRAEHDRWELAHGHAEAPTEGRRADGQRVVDLRLGADRYLQACPPPAGRECAERERRLVGALVVRPAAAGTVGETLHPEWFVDRRWAAGYAAVLDLVASGQPVDTVTVTCRVQELSAAFGAVPTPREVLAAAEDSLTTDPGRAAAAVSADLTVRTAESAAASLTSAAHHPGLRVPDLLDTAHTLVTATLTASNGLRPSRTPARSRAVGASVTPRMGSVAG